MCMHEGITSSSRGRAPTAPQGRGGGARADPAEPDPADPGRRREKGRKNNKVETPLSTGRSLIHLGRPWGPSGKRPPSAEGRHSPPGSPAQGGPCIRRPENTRKKQVRLDSERNLKSKQDTRVRPSVGLRSEPRAVMTEC